MRPLLALTVGLFLLAEAPGCSDRDVRAVGWRDPYWPCERGEPVCRTGCGESETEIGPAEPREGLWRCPSGATLRCSGSPPRPCGEASDAEDAGRDAEQAEGAERDR